MLSSTAARTSARMLATRRTLPFSARFYSDNIVSHYENPRNVGSLDKNDESVGTVRDVFDRMELRVSCLLNLVETILDATESKPWPWRLVGRKSIIADCSRKKSKFMFSLLSCSFLPFLLYTQRDWSAPQPVAT